MRGNPVVAHRGAFKKGGYPENSIAALKEAFSLGCIGTEFDVHMTADEVLVVHHDDDFHKLEIEKSTYDQLKEFTLSNGELLPTLQGYLQTGKEINHDTKFVLEIKPSIINKQRGLLIADRCVSLVNELQLADSIIYISFDYDILKQIHQQRPQSNMQYLNGDLSPIQLKKDGITGADYHYTVYHMNQEWIDIAKEIGVELNSWTVNERPEMEWLLENGFNYITTNEPELLLEVWEDFKDRKG